jgi:hypothetical protein
MKILPGSRWKSAVCDTEVVVVKAPKEEAELQCGGATMLPHNAAKPADAVCAAGQDGGSLLGKRYGDDAAAIEVLCTKAGQGGLAIDGRAMVIRQTVQLPSSD